MSLRKRKLIQNLLMTLLLIPINVSAQEWQINLQKNEPVPFDGVLVPYKMFREHELEAKELALKNEELKNCLSSQPDRIPDGLSFGGYVLTFSVGAVVGFGASMMLRQALR